MGIESPVHLLFIAVVALIVLGPRRLPGLARALGQGIREFRGALAAGEEGDEEPPASPQAPAPAIAEAAAQPAPTAGSSIPGAPQPAAQDPSEPAAQSASEPAPQSELEPAARAASRPIVPETPEGPAGP